TIGLSRQRFDSALDRSSVANGSPDGRNGVLGRRRLDRGQVSFCADKLGVENDRDPGEAGDSRLEQLQPLTADAGFVAKSRDIGLGARNVSDYSVTDGITDQ